MKEDMCKVIHYNKVCDFNFWQFVSAFYLLYFPFTYTNYKSFVS